MTRPKDGVAESDAVRIARGACVDKGIQWREPIRVKKGWRHWTIFSPWVSGAATR